MSVVTKSPNSFEYVINGLEEWMIPFIKVIPIYSVENGYDLSDSRTTFEPTFYYTWHKIDSENYKLLFYTSPDAVFQESEEADEIDIPLYVTLKLYFYNPHYYSEVQLKSV